MVGSTVAPRRVRGVNAIGAALLPMLRAGRGRQTKALHVRSYQAARHDPDNLGLVAHHLIYLVVTGNYWAFTLTDGALRMLVVLHFHQLGYSPLQVAMLFLFYEIFGVVTNLVGGWLGARIGLNRTMNIGLALQVAADVQRRGGAERRIERGRTIVLGKQRRDRRASRPVWCRGPGAMGPAGVRALASHGFVARAWRAGDPRRHERAGPLRAEHLAAAR